MTLALIALAWGLGLVFAVLIAWAAAEPKSQRDDEACANCEFFKDYRATEGNDWANGYCAHPDHFDQKKSPHWEYGGHWTNHESWCQWWRARP
jgi:hypothetical protein